MSLLIVTTCVTIGWLLVQRDLAHIQALIADRGRSLAGYVARNAELSVLSGDTARLAALGQQTQAQHDVVYVRVTDHEGRVLVTTGWPPADAAALVGEAREGQSTVGRGVWEFRAPVMTVVSNRRREEIGLLDAGGADNVGQGGRSERIGMVAVGISLDELRGLRVRTFTTAMLVTGILTLAAVACAVVLARAITQPLKSLVEAANAFAGGDLHARVAVRTADEVGALGVAFNTMVERVAASRAALEEHNRALEERVHARTERLEAMNRELEEANRLKDEFLATVSHELRTPLNVIIGYAEMLADGPLEPDQREVIGGIQRYSKLQIDLITSVLDFARLSSGQMTFRVERFAVGPLLDEIRGLLGGQLWDRDVRFEMDVAPDTPALETDRVKLLEVVRNLVDNAIKFTERGTITVAAWGTPGRDRVVLEVRDTGPGIAETDLAHVFEAFRQVGESSTRGTGGVGLGLAIVKQLVEALGGAILVTSRVGEGATFRVEVPARLPAAAAA
ncbi:MAG: ATP-binding protein [Candidatus Binatia bacterium]